MKTLIAFTAALSASASLGVHADVVIDWNNAALNAIRADRTTPPPPASRALAITHVAIYDAVNGIHRTHRSYAVQDLAPVGASLPAAVAAAAYTTLTALYTNPDIRSTNLNVVYSNMLAAIPDGQPKTDGIAWGQSVANAILAFRASDGSTNSVAYTPSSLPGCWRPTPPAYASALLPNWPAVMPFAMTSGSQFRPPPPPDVAGAAYSFEFNTVKLYGRAISTFRTASQTEEARFWADGAGTGTAPGHWNAIAQVVANAQANTVEQNARLFALVNIALADAGISAWDAKYTHNYWRPTTGIREADTDGNPETDSDPTWTPLVAPPPYPEFTSEHGAFARSAATVLAAFFGTNAIPFTVSSDGLPGVTRAFSSFSGAADECGISQIYAGTQWPSGNLHGQSAGHFLGQHVLTHFLQSLTAARFAAILRAGQQTQLTIEGQTGGTYVIEASTDLQNWRNISTNIPVSGLIQFTDISATNTLRFYRAYAR